MGRFLLRRSGYFIEERMSTRDLSSETDETVRGY